MKHLFALTLLLLIAGGSLAASLDVHADGSGAYPNIQAAVNAAATGDIIFIHPGTYTGPGNRDIVINRDLELRAAEGPGTVAIDCENAMRGFELEYTNVIIDGLTIRNGSADNGGAVRIEGASPEFHNCVFEDNNATARGGAIYVFEEASVTLQYCVLARNHAEVEGGALLGRGWSSLVLRHNTFVLNGAPAGGHVYLLEDTDLYGDFNILAYAHEGEAVGGYYEGTVTINCTDVYGNRGGDWVHALSGVGGSYHYTMDPQLMDPMGGDYRLSPDSPVAGTVGCNTLGAGGEAGAGETPVYGLRPGGRGMFVDLETAMDEIPSQASIVLEDGLYAGAGYRDLDPHGKAMTIRSRSGEAADCTLDAQGHYGGFARVFQLDGNDGDTFRVQGLRLTGGYADEKGGLVLAEEGCGAVFADCLFDGGHADFGNAMAVIGSQGSSASVTFSGCTFTESFEGQYWVPSLDYCQFLGEDAQVHLRFCENGLINHCLFEGLEDLQGGAMQIRYGSGTLRLQASEFVNCRATSSLPDYPIYGGALYMFDPGDVLISGCDFIHCTADSSGGDIYARTNDNSSTLTIENSHFSRTEAHPAQTGGSIWADQFALVLRESTWDGFQGTREGGALWVRDGDLDLTECAFRDCGAQYGGAIYMLGGNMALEDCGFRNNQATALAGAIFLRGGIIQAATSTFTGNRCEGNDGTITVHQSPENRTNTLEYVVFAGNYANHDGAVFGFGYTDYTQRVEFNMCTLYGNNTDPEGSSNGQVYLFRNDQVSFYHSLISHGNGLPVVAQMTGCSATSYCSNIFDNDQGDWVGLLAGQYDHDENISQDPLFCGAEEGDLRVRSDSPCLPDNNACVARIGALGEGCTPASPVLDSPMQAEVALRGAYPNPFNPQTTIAYELSHEANVTLVVHDVSGRVVRTLRSGERQGSGNHHVVWNGRDDGGRRVSSGVYLAQLVADGVSRVQRVAMIK